MSAAVVLSPDVPDEIRPPWAQRRRAYRVPAGLPGGRESWRAGATASLAFHALILLLIVAPFASMQEITPIEQGAGGAGPAGGGGGGTRGSGGIREENLRYVVVAPAPPPVAVPVVVPPPIPVLVEPPKPEIPKVEPVAAEVAPVAGAGGGTGADSTAGSGTGTGGGVGSGVGTGTGSGTGPGTGGGRMENHPPTPREMFIPPMPVPRSAKGARLVIQFDVDERGAVRGIEFNQTPDRGYNRRLREVFETFRFRPGTRPDGTPIRMKFQMEIDLP